MSKNFSEISDLDGKKYPKRINVSVSADTEDKYIQLKKAGKNAPEFARKVLEAQIAEAYEKVFGKKAG